MQAVVSNLLQLNYLGKRDPSVVEMKTKLTLTQTKAILMSDNDVMSLPEWDAAFDESIERFTKQNHKEPTLLELQNLIEVLIQSFRAHGSFKPPIEKHRSNLKIL